ncbi:MAG: helix-turn-helix domain-containing protein [Armatimonadota bacterium]
MSSRRATLISHPVRSRILTALMGRRLTTYQIGHLLPDVALSSIYRHLRLLVEGGIVEPVEEVRVNGALTRVYAVRTGETRIGPDDTGGISAAEHLGHFGTFQNLLAELFRSYLAQEGTDPAHDPFHALMGSLHLSPGEYREFMEELRELLERWGAQEPGGDRRRLVFAHLMIPDREDPPLTP